MSIDAVGCEGINWQNMRMMYRNVLAGVTGPLIMFNDCFTLDEILTFRYTSAHSNDDYKVVF